MAVPLDQIIVAVREPRRVGDDVSYNVELLHIDAADGESLFSVRRTYRDCKHVIKCMSKCNRNLPEVPRTAVIGALDPLFVEQRRAALEAFFNAALAAGSAEDNSDLQDATGYSEYALHACIEPVSKASLPDALTSTSLLHFILHVPTDAVESELFTAARYALRTTSYTVGQLLPRIGPFESLRKAHAVVRKEGGETGLMRISVLGPTAPCGLEKNHTKSFQRLLTSLDPKYFAPASDVIVANGRLFVVRKVFQEGSLLDHLHGTWGPSALMHAHDKYSRPTSALPLEKIARIGFQLLQIIGGCHQFDLPVPTLLSLGNILVASENPFQIVLGDCFEDVIAGTTRIPVLPPSSRSEEKTPMDLLLFGCVMLQLSLGTVFDEITLAALLSCQGDPIDRRPTDEQEPVNQIAIRSLPKFDELPDVLRNLLFYLFHPANPAEITVLMNHPLFTEVKEEVLVSASEEDVSAIDEDGIPLFKLKTKDIALIEESSQRWVRLLLDRESKRISKVAERKAVREAKQLITVNPLPEPRPASPRKVRSAALARMNVGKVEKREARPAQGSNAPAAPTAPSAPAAPGAPAAPMPKAPPPSAPVPAPAAPPVPALPAPTGAPPPPPPVKGPPPPPGVARKTPPPQGAPLPPPPPMRAS